MTEKSTSGVDERAPSPQPWPPGTPDNVKRGLLRFWNAQNQASQIINDNNSLPIAFKEDW